jgi:hypothetical protein
MDETSLFAGTPPPRSRESRSFNNLDNDSLWHLLAESNNLALVGVKDASMTRGIFRGHILLAPPAIDRAVSRISRIGGARVVDHDAVSSPSARQQYPAVIVELADDLALPALRSLYEVDYVEPLYVTPLLIGRSMPTYTPDVADEAFSPRPGVQPNKVSWNFRHMAVQDAWRLFNENGRIVAPGRGITIGVVDTGTFPDQPRLNEAFDVPAGTRSPPKHLYVDNPEVVCSHGTRIAGLATAPADGISTNYVGVAWGSDLVSVRINDGVVAVGGTAITAAGRGLEMAVAAGARVITLAFGLPFESQYLRDKITAIYDANPHVILIGAAGTSVSDVVFPATMQREIVTVSIVDFKPSPPYVYVRRGAAYIPDQVAYGPAVDFVAVHSDSDLPTTGSGAFPLTSVGGSSCATAMIGGIVALAWSRLPHLSRDELIARLARSAVFRQIEDIGDSLNGRTITVGWGIPDAYIAAGGARRLSIEGPVWHTASSYRLVAHIDGHVSLYTFLWNTGEVTESITTYADGVNPRKHTVSVTNRHDGSVLRADITVKVSQSAKLRITDVFAEGGGDTASVEWMTDKPATGSFEYGTSEAYGLSFDLSATLMTAHSVVLRGLRHEKRYHFHITCQAADGSSANYRGSFYNPENPN